MSSYADPKPDERGYPPLEPEAPKPLPPGGAKWLVPPHLQTLNFLNAVSRTFPWTHDEALRDSLRNANLMWADSVISTAVRDRQRPVVQLEWQLEERNPTDPAEKRAKEIVTEILEDIPDFQQMRRALLDALWWGRAGVQLAFEWKYVDGQKRLVVNKWVPLHGDSIVFKFDGSVGCLVHPGLLKSIEVPGVEIIEGLGGAAKFFTPEEAQGVLVHQFEPEAASYHQPEMAGSIKGSGYRGRVYWYWWLKHNLQRILMNFAKKAGNGFFLAGYEAGNRDDLAAVTEALESQDGQNVIYVPTSQGFDISKVLTHVPVSFEGASFQWTIIQGLNGLIRDAILGETNANSPAPTGLGGSQAEQRGMTDDERVKYDAVDVETPLQHLTNVIYRWTFPGVRPARFQHMIDKRSPVEFMQAAQFAMQAGLTVGENDMRSELGLPKPPDGEPVLSLVQSQQATALGSVPAGVPIAGTPGPEGQVGQPQGAAPDDAALASQITPE